MTSGFIVNLPLEIAINILSRLPPRAVVCCKCVCRSWLKLLDTREFVKLHLSKSVPGMAVVRSCVLTNSYEIFEFEDKLDLEHHHLRYSSVTKFVFPHASRIHDRYSAGSANGLLFLTGDQPCHLYVCNPITRRCIKLRPYLDSLHSSSDEVAYGFGVTKTTGQYKVVRIVYDYDFGTEDSPNIRLTKSHCEVYTLGTRTWRSVIPAALVCMPKCSNMLEYPNVIMKPCLLLRHKDCLQETMSLQQDGSSYLFCPFDSNDIISYTLDAMSGLTIVFLVQEIGLGIIEAKASVIYGYKSHGASAQV
ncbi:F-box protein At3g07870-like [Salvia hispanica]|uniref:F-box protein At3g07870-like n=1 Tax=Salvia hispanica TaxID=49212 RepID=UPI002009C513|nr:F-box protein At3g07870-like [Salvia hispanica]